VDDEPNLLEGISLHLGRKFEVETATSGAAGLALLAAGFCPAVIVSDMRMPIMDGAAFLAKARAMAPDSVRLLLTGQTDIESAISAVNEGQIFRFLTKPCAPPNLVLAIAAAVEQHQLITAERVLLEQTLHGCIKALTDVLALTNPAAFGRATRIKELVSELAAETGLRTRWQLEVAAMLSQLAHITLQPETAEKLYFGKPLTLDEQKQVEHLPAVTSQLLGNIPRIDDVREILSTYTRPFQGVKVEECDPVKQPIAFASQLLKLAIDFDVLESQDVSANLAIDTLRHRGMGVVPAAMEALNRVRGQSGQHYEVRELTLNELLPGMVLTEDVTMPNGMLLVARGYEVNSRFLDRLRNFPQGMVKDRLRVIVKPKRA
jgi:CheY-like chemotaxis protein